ncbi:hypothetical protein PGT21_010674 [Puccinia graminis f. sp. tritici]|uniref:Uncharacterized protein n=1 Tax=Puccinia graminis f. sp. tritici TaxID=56615 RepID=A0A5B0MNA9_PUCGR|nr:hypothetical protein PGT21_010674 [Puccinia graminis f. sp. tritici]
MADTHTSSNPRTASVLQVLNDLIEKHDESMNGSTGEEREELTQDELDRKYELLDQLHSSLLPSLQDQLRKFLISLDLPYNEPKKYPNPDFEAACEILAQLDQTMDETIECIESAALDVVPFNTHDHHFKRGKDFRCTHLRSNTSTLITDIRDMFINCDLFINDLNKPEESRRQKLSSLFERDVLVASTQCIDLAGKIRKWSQASDFEVIQDEWEEKAESLNSSLETLNTLAQQPTIGHSDNPAPLREHVLELSNWTMLLIKLSKMFLTKISKTKPKKLSFTLDNAINSETLSRLHEPADSIVFCFERHVGTLSRSYESDLLDGGRAEMRDRIEGLSITFDLLSVLLRSCLVPLPLGFDRPSLESDFKAWLAEWKEMWHTTAQHLLNVLDGFQDAHQGQTLD